MIRGAPIELAMEILESVRPAGVSVTTRFIAELCMEIDPTIVVRHQDIYFLEQRALGKLRREFESRARNERRKAVLR